MSNPVYLVQIEDHQGDSWEVDINNETDVEYLTSLRPLLSETCKNIRAQLADTDGCDPDWLRRCDDARRYNEGKIKALDRRIKFLTDPSGEKALERRRLHVLEQSSKTELEQLKMFLSSNYPDALEDWGVLTGEESE